jgi:hypothetical protein
MRFNTYASEFGILIPRNNGNEWVHQSGGYSCTQEVFEGIYYPMDSPWVSTDEDGLIYLTEEIQKFNSVGGDDPVLDWESWRELEDTLLEEFPLVVERIDREEVPEGQPDRGAAFVWVEVTDYEEYKGDPHPKVSTSSDLYETLIGEKIALLYPNAD